VTNKAFLSSRETQKSLGIGYRSRMQRLFHLLPHVYFDARQTRFFPVSYINRLTEYLDGSTGLERIESFTASDEAHQLFRQAQSRFKTIRDSRPEHSPSEVADMLNVGRSTVSGWLLSGSLPYRTVPSRDNTPDRQFITSETLSQAFQWRHPFG
jgi:hypothetical protein